MHDYQALKRDYGNPVSQTVDKPILIFDYFELSDAFMAIAAVMVFGVIFYSWQLMFFCLGVTLGVVPAIRRRSERGVFFHWPYRRLGMSLPGLANPGRRQKYSD